MALHKAFLIYLLPAAVGLSACGADGSSGDQVPGATAAITPTEGPDSFLLFPNPQKQDDGTLQVESTAYATAYYEAIDPTNSRDTLAKFKAFNGFGTTGAGITEESVIVGDQRDLGYGRRMTARQNANGTLAFVVENYLVGGYGAYSPLNLEAAIYPEAKWHLGTNAIEFSPGPGGTINFVKFYTYDPITGARLMMGDLDGRGGKAMPTVCASCHGGRGDPLTPATGSSTGKRLFPRLMNAASATDAVAPEVGGARGDIGAQLHPLEPASFDFSTIPAFTRAMQEAKIKTINKMVLCALPLAAATAHPEDACRINPPGRPAAVGSEYQGTVATHLKDIYGGNGLPQATSNSTDTYVPATWAAGAQANLYLNTQAQACRVCHLLRGTGDQSDIDFEDYAKFDGYSDRIKAHVLDRGNMPLAKLIYDKYWSTPSIYNTMATYLSSLPAGYTNTATQPGRPVADPGPNRVVQQPTTTLSAAMSLYSTAYQWSIVTDPVGGATITNATSSTATLNTTGNGTYVIQLITRRGATTSAAATVSIVVNSALTYNPTALRFTDIKTILQAARPSGACVGCHIAAAPGGGVPPIWYTDFDRNADTLTNATDDHWFYTELRGRINFTDWVASPLLRKPSGNHHNGGLHSRFNAALTPGAADREDYDKILGWIMNGAPE
jgi:mono/diheme cytochrome c family protein